MWWARRHGGFGSVLLVAAGLRVVVLVAYGPALFIPDSGSYLAFASRAAEGVLSPGGHRVSGYAFALVPLMWARSVTAIAVAQHLLGLVSGVLVYALLLARGCRRRYAVLAALPVLFDPLQLIIEQYVLAETLATFLILVAVTVLAWPGDRRRWARPVAAGLLLAGATLVRTPNLVVAVPVLAYLLMAARPWRQALASGGAFAVALGLGLAVPLGAYTAGAGIQQGGGTVAGIASRFLYARVAPIADCRQLDLSRTARRLCPTGHPERRPGPNFYMWSPASPFFRLPAGAVANKALHEFDRQVLTRQPLGYARAVAASYAYGFSPVRGSGPDRIPSWVYKFQPRYTAWDTNAHAIARVYGGTRVADRPGLQRFMHQYGKYHVPGPLLGAGLLGGLAAALGIGPARRSVHRAASFLFTGVAATVLLPPVAMALFSWRYQQPQLSLIPLAAVTGFLAFARRPRAEAPPQVTTAERDLVGPQV